MDSRPETLPEQFWRKRAQEALEELRKMTVVADARAANETRLEAMLAAIDAAMKEKP
jgi:hypothetical protein